MYLGHALINKDDGETYCYRVRYALVPEDRLVAHDGRLVQVAEAHDARGVERIGHDAHHPVLQGFDLEFHDLQNLRLYDLAVLSRPGDILVAFGDQAGVTPYRYRVRWVDVQ